MSEELDITAQTTEEEGITTEAEETVGNADNENDAEFSDDTESGGEERDNADKDNPDKSENAKTWKNEKNAQQAAKRRETERRAEIKKARNEAIIEALNGVNPFTNEKMADETDVEEYLTMKEIEKSGKDPITDYSRHLKNKAKEQEKATQVQQGQEEWIRKDRESFTSKYPDVKLDELVADEMFRTFALGKAGRIPMTKIYDDYQAFEKQSEQRAKIKAAQILANNAATPGKLSNQSPAPEKDIKDMSKSEFEAMIERVKRGEQK